VHQTGPTGELDNDIEHSTYRCIEVWLEPKIVFTAAALIGSLPVWESLVLP
jgi:hypothetical protein